MYVPKPYAVDDPQELLNFIRRQPFGIVVSQVDGKPFATHVPFALEESDDGALRLLLHVARANPQWQSIDGQAVLAIFHGPHAMVSASWYVQPDHNVPTWNYGAVHCSGIARVVDDAGTRRILEALVQHLEPTWRIESVEPVHIERMQRAIVGIEIAVTAIEGSYKYSENRSPEDRERVIDALAASHRAMDREVADIMREF